MGDEDNVEQTLHICRECNVYRIPPRSGADGYKSGEWKVKDKIFSGRLRMIARGDLAEIKIEDPNSGELFAMCPVPYGKKNVAVEPVSDSSRYYVIRVEDPVTKRHAFLGLGFNERGEAFDFIAALTDHEKHVERAKAAASLGSSGRSSGAGTATAAAGSTPSAMQDVQALYAHQGDLSLKAGQTIHINVSKPAGSRLLGDSHAGGAPMALRPLAPPPGGTASSAGPSQTAFFPTAPRPQQQQGNLLFDDFLFSGPQPTSAPRQPAAAAPQPAGDPFAGDLLGLGSSAAPAPYSALPSQPAQTKAPDTTWAVFD